MRKRRPIYSVGAAVAAAAVIMGAMLAVAPPRRAAADAHTYTTTRRQVRAAVITSSAINVQVGTKILPENPDPYVFYVLDSRTDLKPLGMDFVNPLAPAVITSAIYQRWQDRVRSTDPAFIAGTPENTIFQAGAPVTKNMGAYWELNIDSVSDEDLKQYDILYLHSHRQNAIFPIEVKEKLRKFVEAGGTLWVENCGAMTFDSQNPFLYDVSMSANYNVAGGGGAAIIANPAHPVLSYPYALTARDVQNLGDKYQSDPASGGRFLLPGYYLYAAKTPADTAPGDPTVNPPGGQTLTTLIWNSRGPNAGSPAAPPSAWRPLVLAGQVGAGRIIFCSQDTGCKINDYAGYDRPDRRNAGYGGNSQAVSGDVMSAASPPDLKFAYNIAAWSGSHSTSHTDTRHSGGTAERIAGALSEKWSQELTTNGNWRVGGATLFKHCIYVVDGHGILHCFDSKPGQDLDGDGNVDDGLPDTIYGYPYDEVWNFDLNSLDNDAAPGASTPTCYEFYDPNFTGVNGGLQNLPNREQVVVVLSNGKVVALRALPRLPAPGFPLAPVGRDRFGNVNMPPSMVEWVLDTQTINGQVGFPTPGTAVEQITRTIPAATWSEGVVFVSTNVSNAGNASGRVVAIDPRGKGLLAASAFNPGAGTNANGLDSQVPLQPGQPPYIGEPTVGYVRDNTTGAVDKMIYVYTDRSASGQAAPQSIRSIPFGSKGEKLTRQTATNFVSRSTGTLPPVPWFLVDPVNVGNSSAALGQRVYATYTDANGNFFQAELTYVAGAAPGGNNQYVAPKPAASGQQQMVTISANIQFPANGPNAGPTVPAGDPALNVYADYVLDWTLDQNSPLAKTGVRTVMAAPDSNPASGNLVGGPPALSPDDLLYYTVNTTGTAASNAGRGVLFSVNEQPAARTSLRWAYTMHNGFTMTLTNGTQVTVPPRLREMTTGTYITDVQFIGTPAYRKDVIYAAGTATVGGQQATVLCAFKANPEFTLRLNQPIDKTQQVIVKQVNPVRQQGGAPAWEQLTNNPTNQPGARGNTAITVDYDSGLIHINAMANPGPIVNFLSASMPFVVQVGQQEQVIAGKQLDTIGGTEEARMIGAPGVDNLLWYAVIPAAAIGPFPGLGVVSSSPSVQGDTLFVGTENGYILAIDADPAANDPTAQAAGAQVQLADPVTGKLNHLRWIQKVTAPGSNATVRSAPVATENVLAVNTADGARAFEDALTIIADNNRLIEVNSGGDAVWTCDGTRAFGTAGGDISQYLLNGQPINPNAATGVPVVQKIPFARPAVARRINTNDFLVVDTGNNRVVEIDRGGNIIWEVHRLFDDLKGLLRPGDPLSLNEPSDCSYWIEYTPNLNAWLAQNVGPATTFNNDSGTIIHYLITDTGNFRIVELVDVYDSGGRPVRPIVNAVTAPFTLLRQLFFASSTYSAQNKKYRFLGVQRSVLLNGPLKGTAFYSDKFADTALRRFTLAAVTNYRLGSGSSAINSTNDQSLGGGSTIMVLDETGAPVSVVTNLAIPQAGGGYRIQPINNPTSFSKYDEYNANKQLVFHYLLTDANGCYQMVSDVDAQGNPVMRVEWMLTNDDYFRITGKKLNAVSIRRLSTGVSDPTSPGYAQGLHHFLITNRFSGSDFIPDVFTATQNVPNRGEFDGEVFEFDPAWWDVKTGTNAYRPDYMLDPMTGFLVANLGQTNQPASIVWRSPSELIPTTAVNAVTNPNGFVTRFIGSAERATSTGILQKPSYADRPF